MSDGGRPGTTRKKHRPVLSARFGLCPRLIASTASAALNLLAITALVGLFESRPVGTSFRSATLTVVSLAPKQPHVQPILDARPFQSSIPSRILDRLPKAITPAIGNTKQFVPPPDESTMVPAEVRAEHDVGSKVATQSPPDDRNGSELSDYQTTIWRKIEANRPRGVNMSGTVMIKFRILADGTLLSSDVSKSSGNLQLDKIALRSVRQAAPFPKPPEGVTPIQLTFEIAINFH